MKRLFDTGKYYFRRIERLVNQLGSGRQCYICKRRFGHFYPYRNGAEVASPFIKELDLISGDTRNFSCAYCGCHDRERHLFMYFDRLDLWARLRQAAVLHFAPEGKLEDAIIRQGPREYIKADLKPARPDIRPMSVTDIPFPNGHFDFIFCCHVLEHVPDDRRAMAELYRVLRPGGQAVLQTPFSNLLAHTFEDPAIDTDSLRWRYYGQEDHVRLFGRDLFSKLQAAGFRLDLKRHADHFTPEETRRYGVSAKEDLILVVKPTDAQAETFPAAA
ncbi:methyltransferase domain-containing protein [Candidatus Methylocalor cossyra]|uniref:SAM-dependent methyltransferase n=1 Tax=Candidatus Methylocalor cossyra TaxID=3108543 RepID=A0ABM9NJ69_9GAMM